MTKIKNNIIYITFVIVFQIFSSCKDRALAFNGIVYKIDDVQYGYAIYFKEKLFIKQENIPSVKGNIYFRDSIAALKTMDLVLKKLNAGESPTLNPAEVDELKVKI
jgi:Domain of unknown function (DUF4907)